MTKCADIVVFAGAGISAPEPCGLPLFGPLLAIGERMALDTDLPLSEALRELAPETILEYLALAGAPISKLLADTYSHGAPNAIHVALAQLLDEGGYVWTPNVDEMIERSPQGHAAIAAVREGRHRQGAECSLHQAPRHCQSTRVVPLLTTQVTAAVDDELADLLADQCRGRTLLIVGYFGMDPGSLEGVASGGSQRTRAVWFDFPAVARDLAGALPRSGPRWT